MFLRLRVHMRQPRLPPPVRSSWWAEALLCDSGWEGLGLDF